MTDDLRTGLARAMYEAHRASTNQPEKCLPFDKLPSQRADFIRADAALSHFTAHLASKDMVERVGAMLQHAWDEHRSLPPIAFTELETGYLACAVIAAQVAAMGESHG